MSGPLAVLTPMGSGDGMAALVARLVTLDARLRTVDPTWQGLTGTGMPAGGSTPPATTSPGGTDFAGVLSSEAASGAGTASTVRASGVADSVVPVEAAFVTPLPDARVSQGFGPTTLAIEPSAVVDGVR